MSNVEKKTSLIHHLPAVYHQQAEKECDPLRILLNTFEQLLSGIAEKLDRIDTYFDPSVAPHRPDDTPNDLPDDPPDDRRSYDPRPNAPRPADPRGDFLTWLASWVALGIDERWSEEKKRYLIKNAVSLYQRRGTPQGLKCILEQYFDIEVEIKEWDWPPGMVIGRRSSIGIDTILNEKTNIDYCFIVTCKLTGMEDKKKNELIPKIRAVIDLEKPAHTKYYFQLEHPEEKTPKIHELVIGVYSTIGFCYVA